MLTHQEAALESTFQKIVRVIARRYGVEVKIRGGKAYVDLAMNPPCIVLPSCAAGRDVPLEVMDGFLDHECAHVLFTDRDIAKSVEGKTLHGIWNGVEDVWIEREIGRRYIGCHQNLEKLNVWLYERCEKNWAESDALGRLVYALERCYRGDHEAGRYADDPLIGSIMGQLHEEIARGRKCASTREALAIAQSILDKIQDLAKGESPNGGSSSGNSVHGDAHGGADASDGSDPIVDPGVSSKSGKQEIDGDGAEDADSTAGDPQDPETTEEGESDASAGTTREGEIDVEAQAQGQEALTIAQAQARDFMAQEVAGGFDQPLDVEGLVNDHITQFQDWSRRQDPDQYVVFSEEYDIETTWDSTQRIALSREYNKIKQEVRRFTGNLANILELTLNAEAEDRWVGGARRGKKWDQRRLAYWAEGSDDDRLFRYLEEGVRHDTAVTLLWDCSGSMGSSIKPTTKAALARIAAVAFHEALKRCPNITHEVLGFNTGGGYSDELRELACEALRRGEDLDRYSRVEELDDRMVFVPFGSDRGWPIAAITGSAANRDGECVLWAARRLAQRPEKRKLLIVGSDGHPQGAKYHRTETKFLREVVQRVKAAGLEIYGLGIMDDAVSKYYPDYQVIRDIRALPKAVMTLLTSSLPAQTKGRDHGRMARL